jgi:hypothetical protein
MNVSKIMFRMVISLSIGARLGDADVETSEPENNFHPAHGSHKCCSGNAAPSTIGGQTRWSYGLASCRVGWLLQPAIIAAANSTKASPNHRI